jgi:hypothetical protein
VSTRSVIARPTPEGGFSGRYCHYDGYPAHQGRVLFDAVTGHFDGDPDAACRYLIDEHPAGWSVLYGDFAAPPGYRTGHNPDDLRNQCYCHGDRHERPRPPLTDHTARAAWVDYATCSNPTGCGAHQPPGRVAAGRRAGLDRHARLGCHPPARPTPPPRLVAPHRRPRPSDHDAGQPFPTRWLRPQRRGRPEATVPARRDAHHPRPTSASAASCRLPCSW